MVYDFDFDFLNVFSDLHRILRTVRSIASHGFFHRVWKADAIKQQILKCDRMLCHSRDIFFVCSFLDPEDSHHAICNELGRCHNMIVKNSSYSYVSNIFIIIDYRRRFFFCGAVKTCDCESIPIQDK